MILKVTRHQYGIFALVSRTDVISWGNLWWHRETSSVFSARIDGAICISLICFSRAIFQETSPKMDAKKSVNVVVKNWNCTTIFRGLPVYTLRVMKIQKTEELALQALVKLAY